MSAIDLDRPWSTARIVAFDTETTGVNTDEDRIVEVGLAIFEDGELVDEEEAEAEADAEVEAGEEEAPEA